MADFAITRRPDRSGRQFLIIIMNNTQQKIIAIVGPTASGKTAVGVRLAKELNGEIVSADSRQVFRGLDLGTGKDLSEYDGIPYHMIDIKKPGDKFTLFDYLPLARAAIEDIFSRGKVPIIVGGTGLYIQALTEGFQLKSISNDEFLISNQIPNNNDKILSRIKLDNLTVEQLQKILKDLDIEAYNSLADKKNPHRLIRAIERAQEGLVTNKVKPDFEVLQIGIDWSREILNSRIDKRVEDRFEAGMLEETIGLLSSGIDNDWFLSLGLEYRIMTGFLISNYLPADASHQTMQAGEFLISNKISKSQLQNVKNSNEFFGMKENLKIKSHQYAKRQMTWYKRFPEIKWENDYENIENQAIKFLKN